MTSGKQFDIWTWADHLNHIEKVLWLLAMETLRGYADNVGRQSAKQFWLAGHCDEQIFRMVWCY